MADDHATPQPAFPEDRFIRSAVCRRATSAMLAEEQGRSLTTSPSRMRSEAYRRSWRRSNRFTRGGNCESASRQIPMAVASGGTQKIIGQVLEHLKIRQLFDAVVTSEMVKHQKPAPDIFLEAARRIGVDPKFCRAYEDTDLGMRAIRDAGMEAVDVRDLLVKRET
jgi:FMN phosphatase YigB (HAD superfamily)